MNAKKLIIFGLIVVLLFGALYLFNTLSTKKLIEGNPYGKDELHPSTIRLLNNPNYQNIVLPEEVEAKLQTEELTYVYYFSPECQSCLQATPLLMEKAGEHNVDINQYNLIEFIQGWREYNIEYTPTLVVYQNGEELQRIVGLYSAEEYGMFFDYIDELTAE